MVADKELFFKLVALNQIVVVLDYHVLLPYMYHSQHMHVQSYVSELPLSVSELPLSVSELPLSVSELPLAVSELPLAVSELPYLYQSYP